MEGFLPEGETIVALRFVPYGTVGIDNVGQQYIAVPGWDWWGDTTPDIEESGPDGNYLSMSAESAGFINAEIPQGVKSFAYWYRVSEEGSGGVEVTISNGEEEEQFAVLTSDYVESGEGEWVRRFVDLTQCPPRYTEEEFEGDCAVIYLAVLSWAGTVDFAFSTSSDSDVDEDGIYDDWGGVWRPDRGTGRRGRKLH